MVLRARALLRFNPAGLVLSELMRLGFESVAAQLAQQRRQAPGAPGEYSRGLFMPLPGGLAGEGWFDDTASYMGGSEDYRADFGGTLERWWELVSYPSLDVDAYAAQELFLPLVATSSPQTVTATSERNDPAWEGTGYTVKSASAYWTYIGPVPSPPLAQSEASVVVIPYARPLISPSVAAGPRSMVSPWPLGRVATYRVPIGDTAPVEDLALGYADPAAAAGVAAKADPAAAREAFLPTVSVGRYARERKIRMPLWRRAMVARILEGLVESTDALGAIYNSLPKEVRKAVRQEWVEGEFANGVMRPAREVPNLVKLRAVLRYSRELEPTGLMQELMWETMQDYLYAFQSQLAIGAQRRLGFTPSTTAPDPYFHDSADFGPNGERGGINNQHPLARQMPLESLQEFITGRKAREARQSSEQFARQSAIDERARRRRNHLAEQVRRRRYREAQRKAYWTTWR